MDLAAATADLYGLPPKEFTAARDASASDARQAGDKDLATALKQLRKPSVGAWLANMLVRRQPRDIDQLVELGATLRAARSLDGAQIRSATKQKQEAVTKLVRQARSIATKAGQPVSQPAELELEATLDAAFADATSAEALRQGDLTSGLRYSGLGLGAAPKRATSSGTARDASGARATASQVTKAKREVEQARRDAERADADAEKAQRSVTSTEADLKRLRAASTVAARQAAKAHDHADATQARLEHLQGARKRP